MIPKFRTLLQENNQDKNNEDNKRKAPPRPSSKGGGGKKPDDNFDWSRVIRMVFGWGAVALAAVIFMQLFRTDSNTFDEITYLQYERLLREDKIASAQITKSDVNDYYFKGELKNEERLVVNNRDKVVKNITVYLPEPIIRDQEAVWREKGIDYSFDRESGQWLNLLIGFLPWILIIAVWI
jgi:cell division protease FtsH